MRKLKHTQREGLYALSIRCRGVGQCARFVDILQNFSERQILWSLCSVVFLALTLRFPVQTSLSVAPKLQVCVHLGEKCPNFRKMSIPLIAFLIALQW